MILQSFCILTLISLVTAQSPTLPVDFCLHVPDRTWAVNILNCQAYYKCEGSVLFAGLCPSGQLLHQLEVYCEAAHLVAHLCPSTPAPPPPVSPPSHGSCPSGFTGISPNKNDCSQFFTCRNGISRVQHCGPFKNFDVNLGVCRIRQFAKCA